MDSIFSQRILMTKPSFVREMLKVTEDDSFISFAGGLPNPISFPMEELQDSINRIMTDFGQKLFQYSSTEGLYPLREWIANRYQTRFGWNVSPEDIIITTGSQQGLDLMGKVLLNKGDSLIMEKPGYLGAIQAFSLFEPDFVPINLLEDGLDTKQLKNVLDNKTAKLMYTVPNFQNPTGITYSKEKREEVFELLNITNTVLIEDDPYGELRFEGEELPYIGANRLKNSVIFGTFSKTITPGMRLGFLCTQNESIKNHIVTAKQASDLHTNIFAQYVIYDYLKHNDYDTHIAKIKALYKEQSQAMITAMEQHFPKNISYTRPQGGMFMWAELEEGKSALSYIEAAMKQKVLYVPGDSFYSDSTNVNTLRLNYTNSNASEIEEGIKRLGAVFQSS